MVDFGSTRVPFELRSAKLDPAVLEGGLSLPMPVNSRAVSVTLSAALETLSFTDPTTALIFEVDSSPGIETEGAVSVRMPSADW